MAEEDRGAETPSDQPAHPPRPQNALSHQYQPKRKTMKRSQAERDALRAAAERRLARRRPNRIPVPESLPAMPHPLAAATLSALKTAKASPDGTLAMPKKALLEVSIGPDSIDRAMRIMDTLLKAIDARGWSVHVTQHNHHQVRVKVGEEEFGLYLYEEVATRPHVPTAVEKQQAQRDFLYTIPKREKYLTGKLSLGFTQDSGNGGGASDSKRWRLEECLDLVVKGLADAAAGAEEFRAQIERNSQARLAAERQREELERQHAMARARAEEAERERHRRATVLVEHLERMRISDAARAYADRLEARAADLVTRRTPTESEASDSAPAAGDLQEWIRWVREQADKLDPCKPGTAEAEGLGKRFVERGLLDQLFRAR